MKSKIKTYSNESREDKKRKEIKMNVKIKKKKPQTAHFFRS